MIKAIGKYLRAVGVVAIVVFRAIGREIGAWIRFYYLVYWYYRH